MYLAEEVEAMSMVLTNPWRWLSWLLPQYCEVSEKISE